MTTPPPLLDPLVERLKAPAYWKSSDGYSEAFDNAPEQAATALEALAAENGVLREAAIDCAASLNAAISLLERGGKSAKKAAPSDKMFDLMVADYKASLERARATLNGAPQP